MKKIYFTLGLGVLFLGANAQQTIKIKNNFTNGNHGKTIAARNANGGHNNVSTVTGSIVCNNGYVAGTTMDLNLRITTTNTDGEYIDSLAITFPAGFTVNSTSATPTFPTADAGGGAENYNGIAGQTISWGTNVGNTDQYGGIWASPAQDFKVNVTITATVTGTQLAPFFAHGDGYPATPGNLSGNIALNPAVPNDLAAIASLTQTGCMNMPMPSGVLLQFWNRGTAAQSNFPVKYIANNGTPVVETYTGTVNPNDTVVYVFNTPLTMSVNTIYNVNVLTALSTDVDVTNDTASTVGYNSFAVPYSSGFEAPNGSVGFGAEHVTGTGNSWSIDTQVPHTGVKDALLLSGVAGASDDWLYTPCLDLTAGKTYQVKYWYACYKTSTIAGGGAIGIAIGDSAKATHMTSVIKPATTTLTPVTYSATWVTAYKADSLTFTVPTTGTYVMGFEGKNTVATKQAFLAIDDINITDLGFTGVKTLTNSNDLSIYPNPTSGLLNITTTAATATIEVYNLMGQNVMSKTLTNGTNTIDISNLSNGVYTIHVMQNNALTVGKIIKVN